MQKALFIGGPGNISSSAIEQAAKQFETAVFTLPESRVDGLASPVKLYRGDRNDVGAFEAVLAEFRPDITVDTVCFTPEQARETARLVSGRVAQHIFLSTVDVYGYPLPRLPVREDDPQRPALGQYALDKVACEEIFWHAAESGLPLTVVRPLYSLGRTFVISFFSRNGGLSLVARLRAGSPVIVPGDGTTLIQAGNARNTGRMLATLMGRGKAIGRAYNCGHADPMTHDEYVAAIGRVAGAKPQIVHIPTDLLLSIAEVRETILPDLTRYDLAYSVERFLSDFPEFRYCESVEDGLRDFVNWHDERGDWPDPSEPISILEDRLIGRWAEVTRGFAL